MSLLWARERILSGNRVVTIVFERSLMSGEETHKLKESLGKAKKACKVIKILCLVCLVCSVLVWLLYSIMLIISSLQNESGNIGWGEVAYFVSFGLLISSLLFIALRVFSDIVAGESPFTLKQVKRLRLAGTLLLLFVILDAFFSLDFSFGTEALGYNFGIIGNRGSESPSIKVNVFAIITACMCYGLSIVFKYGVLLQELSDETL